MERWVQVHQKFKIIPGYVVTETLSITKTRQNPIVNNTRPRQSRVIMER